MRWGSDTGNDLPSPVAAKINRSVTFGSIGVCVVDADDCVHARTSEY